MSVLSQNAHDFMGCHKSEQGYRFRVWAPNARAVSLCGDFSGWSDIPMIRGEDGVWSADADAKHGDIYKYAVTGADGLRRMKADPFARHAETGPATGSKVWDADGYTWTDGAWMTHRAATDWRKAPVNIYELHLGSWRLAEGETYPNYRVIAPQLADYCRKMHFTHVELLPLTEYPFEGSWGYQVTGYFAPTSRYGTPEDFMALIDTLHAAGIGVILDWVPAHFPRDEHGLARFDGTALYEYADARLGEHKEWGTLVFDYASPDVRNFLLSSACFFIENYHIDALRCDAVSSMLYLDYAREPGEWLPNRDGGNVNYDARDFLRELNTVIRTKYKGVFTVAEESTAYPGVTAEDGLGFTFKWDMGFMHDTLDYFEADPVMRSGLHNKLTFSMMYAFSEHYVNAFSHDEVVHGKRSMLDKMFGDYRDKFSALRALYGFQFAHPGKKLGFMGSEFGQFIEWNYKQPLDWLLLDYPAHQEIQRFYAALGEVYITYPALWQNEETWEGFCWLNPDDRDRSSVAVLRCPSDGSAKIVCLFNFTPVAWEHWQFGLPAAGRLVPLLDSDEYRFGGTGTGIAPVKAEPSAFREYPYSAFADLPPLCARYYLYEEDKP